VLKKQLIEEIKSQKMISKRNKIKISRINNQIRDFLNSSAIKKTDIYLKKQEGCWDQFCAALDTIGDTCLAINKFQENSEAYFTNNPYLLTYGLLQAMVLQQNAVKYLKKSVLGKDINFKKNYPDLFQIRRLRNETIGHPIETKIKGKNSEYNKNEITICTINRYSLTKEGFSYILWMCAKNKHKHIKFQKIIDLQEACLSIELFKILKELELEESKHKNIFKNKSLSKLTENKSFYQVNLIYGLIWDDPLAWPSFEYCQNKYQKIKIGLEKRYGKFEDSLRISGTVELIKKLDYIFSKISFLKKTKTLDKQECEIYVDALSRNWNELNEHLIEVDSEFKIQKQKQLKSPEKKDVK